VGQSTPGGTPGETLTRGRLADHPLWAHALAQEQRASRLIVPLIVSAAVEDRERVPDSGGLERLSITELVREARRAAAAGLGGLLIYGASDRKDEAAIIARQPDHVVIRAVWAVKQAVPDLPVATDVCVCAYVAHGQCVLFARGEADVAQTLEVLAEIALLHARAGADLLVPSGMLDGTVAAVRGALAADHPNLPVAAMAKLESSLYSLHRIAVGAVPIAERAVPLLSADGSGAARARVARDLAAGADAVVVKPGTPALDLVHVLAGDTDRPVISFHTADEHAAFAAAAEVIDAPAAERETLAASRRAGAAFVISHGAWSVAESD
jgi:porphobilinogen synthase